MGSLGTCLIKDAKFGEIATSEVESPRSEEAEAVSGLAGLDLTEVRSPMRKISKKQRGVMVSLWFPDNGAIVKRFLSDEWVREALEERTGKRVPPLSDENLEFFAKGLRERETPVSIATFDRSVDLSGVRPPEEGISEEITIDPPVKKFKGPGVRRRIG
jgi:hypothetical protein